MALNSVAPWRRAASRKSLAENAVQQHQAGPAGQRAHDRVGRRVDVEQRQRGHHPVGGGQLHPEREPLAGHRVRPVGLDDQLGPPGRAGGRDEHGRVAGLDAPASSRVPRAAAASCPGSAQPAAPARRCRARARPLRPHRRRRGCARLRGQAGQPAVGDQRPRAGLAEQPGQLGRRAARVDRDGHRAQRGQRQPGDQVRRGVPRGDHDQVPATHAGVAQRGRGQRRGGRRRRRRSARRSRCAATCRPRRARPPRASSRGIVPW